MNIATQMKPEEKQRRVLDAIMRYQDRHPGWSPSDDLLSRESELPIGEVKRVLEVLEKNGEIGIIGRWPRQMWVTDETRERLAPKPKVVEPVAPAMATPTKPAVVTTRKRKTKRLPTLTRAYEVAKAMDEMNKAGEKIGVKLLSAKIYGHDQTGYMSTLLKKMKAQGWVSHSPRKQNDLKLTPLGRAQLLGEQMEAPREETPVETFREEPVNDPFGEIGEGGPQELREEDFPPGTKALKEPIFREGGTWEPTTPLKELLREQLEPLAEAMKATAEGMRILATINVDLTKVSDADLALEAINRGFKISR